MAAVVTREFAAEAEIDDDATARLQSAVACFVDYCRTCSYPDRTDGEIMVALELHIACAHGWRADEAGEPTPSLCSCTTRTSWTTCTTSSTGHC
jgi:hypothetical protein